MKVMYVHTMHTDILPKVVGLKYKISIYIIGLRVVKKD